jgi:transposase
MNTKRSKLTKKHKIKLIEHFVAGTTARTTADLVGVNKNTAQLFFHKLRILIINNQKIDPFL